MFDPPGPLDDERPTTPPSPDDRLWRHPSEVAAQARAAATPPLAPPSGSPVVDRPRHLRGQRFSLGTVVVAGSLGAFAMFASLVAMGLVSGMPPTGETHDVDVAGSTRAVRSPAAPSPDGVVAVRLTSTTGVAYGAGLVIDRSGDLVTTLSVGAATTAEVASDADTPTWTAATVVAADSGTGLVVLRPPTPMGTTPATITAPRLSDAVSMFRPGAPTSAVLAGTGSTRVSGTNATLRTVGDHCVGLMTLTSPRRTGPSEVALTPDGGAVMGLVMPGDDDPEDEVAYAVPADVAVDVGRQLVAQGHVRRGGFDATLATAPTDPSSIVVAATAPGGQAESAGLLPGDELISIDGRRVHSPDDVAGAVLGRVPGDSAVVVVRRGQRQTTLAVPLADGGASATPMDLLAVSTTIAAG